MCYALLLAQEDNALSLTFNSRIIADTQVQGLTGLRGIGCYQLRFSVDFKLPNWGPHDETIVLSGLRAEIPAVLLL